MFIRKIFTFFMVLSLLLSCEKNEMTAQEEKPVKPQPVIPDGMAGKPVGFVNSENEKLFFQLLNENPTRKLYVEGVQDEHLTLLFADSTKVAIQLPASLDLGKEKSIRFQLSYPELICKGAYDSKKIRAAMGKYGATEQMFLQITDKNQISHTVKYPFSNVPWLFDGRAVLPWCINLTEYRARGVDLSNIESIVLLMASGKGVVEIHDMTFSDEPVMDLTRALQSETISFNAAYNALESGSYWGSCILKEGDTYHRYTAWFFDGKAWYRGFVNHDSSPILFPANSYSEKKDLMSNRPDGIHTDTRTFGYYVHNPEVIKGLDGRYYFYFLSHKGGESGDDGSIGREIGVASSDNPEGPWNFEPEPIITIKDHAWPDYVQPPGYHPYGVGNPRVIMKDNRYYLFYKILARRSNGGDTFYLYYNCAVSDSPVSGFKMLENIEGLKGFSMNNQLYRDAGMGKPGNQDIEDACFFQYNGKYYGVIKDFMGFWNRTATNNSLTLWESKDLLHWRVSDFPLITKKVRELKFKNETKWFELMERPYLFIDSDGVTGVMTFTVYENITVPFDFRKM